MRPRDLPAFYRTWTAQDSRGRCVSQLERTPHGALLLRLGCTRQYEFPLTPDTAATLREALDANTPATLGPLALAPASTGATLTATLPTDSWTLSLTPTQATYLSAALHEAITGPDAQI